MVSICLDNKPRVVVFFKVSYLLLERNLASGKAKSGQHLKRVNRPILRSCGSANVSSWLFIFKYRQGSICSQGSSQGQLLSIVKLYLQQRGTYNEA